MCEGPLRMELAGRRRRGRLKRRFMEAAMQEVELLGVGKEDRIRWRQMSGCGEPRREETKGEDLFTSSKHHECVAQGGRGGCVCVCVK